MPILPSLISSLRRRLARLLFRLADVVEMLRPQHLILPALAVLGVGIAVTWALPRNGDEAPVPIPIKAEAPVSIEDARAQARVRALEALRANGPKVEPAPPPPPRLPTPKAAADAVGIEPAGAAFDLADRAEPPDPVWSMMVAERVQGLDVLPLEEALPAPSAEVAVRGSPPPGPAPPAGGPAVALVIDDLGHNPAALERLLDLGVPLTLAFLPYPDRAPALARRAAAAGAEVFLHLPMQAEGEGEDPGPDALTVDLSSGEIRARVEAALGRIDGAVGVNNHMGSRFTAAPSPVEATMAVLAERGLVFLDSRTSSQSVAAATARAFGLPWAGRDVFLDNDPEPDMIRARLDQLKRLADRYGQAIGIGHPHPATLRTLEAWVPDALNRGVRFVTVRELITLRDCKRNGDGACPGQQLVGAGGGLPAVR